MFWPFRNSAISLLPAATTDREKPGLGEPRLSSGGGAAFKEELHCLLWSCIRLLWSLMQTQQFHNKKTQDVGGVSSLGGGLQLARLIIARGSDNKLPTCQQREWRGRAADETSNLIGRGRTPRPAVGRGGADTGSRHYIKAPLEEIFGQLHPGFRVLQHTLCSKSQFLLKPFVVAFVRQQLNIQ